MTGRLYQRGKIWWMRYTHRGREHRRSCETDSKTVAQSKMDMVLSKIRVTGFVPTSDVRLEDLVTNYIKDAEANGKPGVAKRATRMWELHLNPYFGRVKITSLATIDFVEYRRHRLGMGAEQSTINRETQVLIGSYKLGYKSTPPTVERVPYIPLAKEDNARQCFITEAERERIYEAASKEGLAWRVFAEMAFLLGWRRGELLGLRVKNISVVDRVVRIDDTKNGDPREAPLTERLVMLLQQLISGRPADDFVFGIHAGANFQRGWDRIRNAAGCPNAWWHDWRRTSARTKRNAGVPEGVIMQLQGWRTSEMFRRYAIVNNDDKRKAIELVEPGGQA